MAKKKDESTKRQQEGQRNIPREVHREASRVAKNLFRLPPKPLKK